jgi:hypothetical protein
MVTDDVAFEPFSSVNHPHPGGQIMPPHRDAMADHPPSVTLVTNVLNRIQTRGMTQEDMQLAQALRDWIHRWPNLASYLSVHDRVKLESIAGWADMETSDRYERWGEPARYDEIAFEYAKHKYSSTQFDLPPSLFKHLTDGINKEDLGPEGLSDNLHLTTLYGLHTDDAEEIRKTVCGPDSLGPIIVSFGPVDVFTNDDADVLKVSVGGGDLYALNAKLAELPHTDTHDGYCPHVTIAFLKRGMGGLYAGKSGLEGIEMVLSRLTFSSADGETTEIDLSEKGQKTRPKVPENNDATAASLSEDKASGKSVERHDRADRPLQYEAVRAPTGYTHEKPLMIGGRPYIGGEWIPGNVVDAATLEEKSALGMKPQPPAPPIPPPAPPPPHPAEELAKKGAFTPEELALPPKAKQPVPHNAGYDQLHAAAVEADRELQALLDLGKGIGAQLGYKTIPPSASEEERDAALREPGGVVMLGPIKGRKRATEKVEGEYKNDWSKVTDMTRASVAVDSMEELHKVLDKLRASGLKFAQKPKDRIKDPRDEGYRDLLTHVTMPNGIVAELQLHVKPMLIAKAAGHKHYEIMRGIDAAANKEKRDRFTPEEEMALSHAFDQSQAIYNKAWEQVLGAGHA